MLIPARRGWGGRAAVLALCFLATACLGPDATPTPVPLPTAAPTSTVPPPTPAPAAPTATLPPPTPAAPPTATPLPATPTTDALAPTWTPGTTNQELLTAFTAMAAVQTYHYTATVQTIANGQPVQATVEGDFHAPDQLQWATATGELTTTAILSGSLYYAAVGSAGWTLLPAADHERAHQLLWTLIAQARNVVEADRDPLTADDPTVHYTFRLLATSVALALPPYSWGLLQGDVWIGQTDHRVRAFKLYAQSPTYETTERLYLSAYDAPVQIALPNVAAPEPGLQGRLLYLHQDTSGSAGAELRVRDLSSGADDRLLALKGALNGAVWAPDGHHVLYSATGILNLLDADSGDVENLGRGLAPAWAPDGDLIAFVRGSGHTTRAWLADPHVMQPISLGSYFVQQIAWAPDGTHFLISGWAPAADPDRAQPQLYTLDADGGNVLALPTVPGGAESPRWSPDGTQIAFLAGGHAALLTPAGGQVNMLDSRGTDSGPIWSPDGSALIFGHRDSASAPQEMIVHPLDGTPPHALSPGDDQPLDWQ